MRIALAQINPTIGDIDGNAKRIETWIGRAQDAGADLVVLPELALSGYPPADLLLHEGFLAEVAAGGKHIGETCTKGITAVFGTPLPLDGNGIANSLLAYRDGALIDYYDKQLLPTYDVFDEDRYFTPGDRAVIIDVAGKRVGLSICEDLWHGEDSGFAHHYEDHLDPVAQLVSPPTGAPGAEIIINPSASPFVLGKISRHRQIMRKHATQHNVYVAATNQVGGNDDLIFSGHSCVIDPTGNLIAASNGFEENLLVTDIKPGMPSVDDPATSTPLEEDLYRALVLGVRDYLRKTGFSSAVIGLSGGIDSAVTAVIAAGALGPENVVGVGLPSRYSSEGSKDDARLLAEYLGLEFHLVPIEQPFIAAEKVLAMHFENHPPDVTEENMQSRIRCLILMAFSNKFGHLLLTTGNKSELAVGYCTLYGDMSGGLAVLSDIGKLNVYKLAKWMNDNPDKLGIDPVPTEGPIPIDTITKPPSAELRPDQLDQDSLPPYDVLDEILERYVERKQHPRTIIKETGFDEQTVDRIVRLIDLNEYKRKQAATGLKVTSVAFGSGRRVPIAQRWRPWERA